MLHAKIAFLVSILRKLLKSVLNKAAIGYLIGKMEREAL
jgi:hypothetical protein